MKPVNCLYLQVDDKDPPARLASLDDEIMRIHSCALSEFEADKDTSFQLLLLMADALEQGQAILRDVLNAAKVPRVLVFPATEQVDTRILQQWPLDDYVALDWDPDSLLARMDWILARFVPDAGLSSSSGVMSVDAILQLNNSMVVTDANNMASQLFASSCDALRGVQLADLFAEASRTDLQSVIRNPAGDTEAFTGRTIELLAKQADGTRLPVEVYVGRQQPDITVMFLRDISSQYHYRGAYFRHEMHMRNLGRLVEDLLHSDRRLDYGGILRLLVPAIGAVRGRFYLTEFEVAAGNWKRECVAEWWTEQTPAPAQSTSDLSAAAVERDKIMSRWFSVLAEGEIVATPADNLPEHEAAVLQSRGIKSLLVIPLMLKGKLLGFIRFDSARAYPGWEAGDVGFLKSATRSICHAYATIEERRYRIETQEELYHERVWLETIRLASELITSTDSLETRLTDIFMYLLNVIPVDQFIISTLEDGQVRVNGVYTLGRDLKSFQYWKDIEDICVGHGKEDGAYQVCNHSGMEIIESGKVMRSCVCLPLKQGDEQLGTMSLASEEKDIFNERNRTHLESLATQLAHVVVHIKRYQAARTEAEHLAVIVREVHHRIKNNLQGVIGLLNQHRNKGPEVDQVISMAIAQLNAIAEAHNQLSRRPNETVYLGDLVSGVCKAVKPLTAHTIAMDDQSAGNQLVVPAAEVVPVALVVNELIQNALDHGFDAEEGGRIKVSIRESGDRAMLTIANDGKPPPASFDSGSGKGFGTGLTLVNSLLPTNGADFSLAHTNGWTVAAVSYAVPTVLQRG